MPKTLLTALLTLLTLSLTLPVQAEDGDTLFNRLYADFIKAYNESNSDKAFYEAADKLSDYYRANGKAMNYYKTQVNICFYDTEHNRPLDALKRANKMLEEMTAEGVNAYSQVYLALGTIFESRGNTRMALHYYEQSLNNVDPDDESLKMTGYSHIAYLLMLRNPNEAEYWNKKYGAGSSNYPAYRQVYLFLESMINFAVGNKHGFQKSYQEYLSYHQQHQNLDNYGAEALQLAEKAFNGEYDEALKRLESGDCGDLTVIAAYDMRILVYKMMNRYDKALEMAQKRAECTDSLNSDMLFLNMNELNTQAGLAQAQTKAAKVRERMLIIILAMAVIIIILLLFYFHRNRKQRKELKQKNEQLSSALAMAEEGEKMKSEFVRNVSHEIRTPLNAINGFNGILNTPGITLSEEERSDMLARINENTQAITNIVDEMLRVADKESNKLYEKSEKLFCNQFFSSILYGYRNKVSASIELKYTTRLLNRQRIATNEDGVRKILQHLIDNAVKFTSKGTITMHSELSEKGDQLFVSISDTGKGISKEKQDKIFEGFYKEDSFQQGIGLGLTVSKKIAHKLGGDLTLDTDYTEGARFVLTLPIG
ncbi:MAG: HAMP domain-containing histidine kinase [Prevotella sp.]|nr:HAMP domain-containing histidine kinase [Prevotella sp.]